MSRVELEPKIIQFPTDAFIIQPVFDDEPSADDPVTDSKIVSIASRIHSNTPVVKTDLSERLSISEPDKVISSAVTALANLISAAHHRGVETAPFVPDNPFDRA